MRLHDLISAVAESIKKPNVQHRSVVGDIKQVTIPSTIIKMCPMYLDTSSTHIDKYPELDSKIDTFLNFKVENGIKPAGPTDKLSKINRPFATEIPGMRKVHLTFDISLWYTISGLNPRVIKLYAVLTHDESGTGQPEKIPKQKSVAKKMASQDDCQSSEVQITK